MTVMMQMTDAIFQPELFKKAIAMLAESLPYRQFDG
jgi:hypothetical protein